MWNDSKIYTHAIVRDPVDRLISAYVNKLSCGLYSVPAHDKGDQKLWTAAQEAGNLRYIQNVLKAANMGAPKKISYKCPCHGAGYLGDKDTSKKGKAECEKTNFTSCTCAGMSIDEFATAISKIYPKWGEQHETLNSHFKPQTGQSSCFSGVEPQDYDKVSTISNAGAMLQFSKHLSSHNHGLWGGHASNAHGNLYLGGKPWRTPPPRSRTACLPRAAPSPGSRTFPPES